MADGIDALEIRRSRSNRTIPPSRHGARRTPVSTPEPALEAPQDPAGGAPLQATAPPTPIQPTTPAAPAESEALVRTTIHLGAGEDSFLDEVRYAGRQSRPKIDASRSAVVRLALARLADEMSPEQVVAELKKRTPKTTPSGGRPRR